MKLLGVSYPACLAFAIKVLNNIMLATNAESVDSVDQLAQLPVFRNKIEQQVYIYIAIARLEYTHVPRIGSLMLVSCARTSLTILHSQIAEYCSGGGPPGVSHIRNIRSEQRQLAPGVRV